MDFFSVHDLQINKIDCTTLSDEDKKIIEEIGFWRYLDYAADRQLAEPAARKTKLIPVKPEDRKRVQVVQSITKHHRTCRKCGNTFYSRHRDARYCGQACQKRTKRAGSCSV